MNPYRPLRCFPAPIVAATCLVACLAVDLRAQIVGGPPPGSPPSLPQGITREQMWPAPTAADWQKPVQITFQRTWEDALAVAKETNKPILVCINMDGEIASEHYTASATAAPRSRRCTHRTCA